MIECPRKSAEDYPGSAQDEERNDEVRPATLAGAVSDKVGGGRLAVTGDLAFAEGASVQVAAEASELEAVGADGLVLATATGGLTGLPALGGNLSANWRLAAKDGRLLLKKMSGLTVVVR